MRRQSQPLLYSPILGECARKRTCLQPCRGNLPPICNLTRVIYKRLAFQAIVDTLPASVGFENKRAANGDWFIWLDHATVAKLKAMRAPGDSFSDVILALAKDE